MDGDDDANLRHLPAAVGARFVVELPGAARASLVAPPPPMEAPWPAS